MEGNKNEAFIGQSVWPYGGLTLGLTLLGIKKLKQSLRVKFISFIFASTKQMKKTIVIVTLLAVIFCGCQNPEDMKDEKKFKGGYTSIVIDSCEYITSYVYMGESICHKGNCRFCRERNKKLAH